MIICNTTESTVIEFDAHITSVDFLDAPKITGCIILPSYSIKIDAVKVEDFTYRLQLDKELNLPVGDHELQIEVLIGNKVFTPFSDILSCIDTEPEIQVAVTSTPDDPEFDAGDDANDTDSYFEDVVEDVLGDQIKEEEIKIDVEPEEVIEQVIAPIEESVIEPEVQAEIIEEPVKEVKAPKKPKAKKKSKKKVKPVGFDLMEVVDAELTKKENPVLEVEIVTKVPKLKINKKPLKPRKQKEKTLFETQKLSNTDKIVLENMNIVIKKDRIIVKEI